MAIVNIKILIYLKYKVKYYSPLKEQFGKLPSFIPTDPNVKRGHYPYQGKFTP